MHKFFVTSQIKKIYCFLLRPPVYVDASQTCNMLVFQLAAAGARSWSIKVSQYNCDYPNLAPTGCTQVTS